MSGFEVTLREKLPDLAIRPAETADGDLLLALLRGNTYYFARTQANAPTREECLEDLTALPPGTEMAQKSYLLLSRAGTCVAALDFIRGYPDGETGFLGLLIINASLHGRGLGRQIVDGVLHAAGDMELRRVALGCFERNEVGLAFWRKMGFAEYGRIERQVDGEDHVIVRMERQVLHG